METARCPEKYKQKKYTQEHKKLEFALIIQINLYSNLQSMLHIQPYIPVSSI
jgi:hypothetical protein